MCKGGSLDSFGRRFKISYRQRASRGALLRLHGYGTLIGWAEELGHNEIVRFLTANLNEEKAANSSLTSTALRKGVNRKAAS
jgi:hypothetical protein